MRFLSATVKNPEFSLSGKETMRAFEVEAWSDRLSFNKGTPAAAWRRTTGAIMEVGDPVRRYLKQSRAPPPPLPDYRMWLVGKWQRQWWEVRVLNVFLRCKSSRISDGLDKWGVTESGVRDLAKVSGLSPELKELAFSEASEMRSRARDNIKNLFRFVFKTLVYKLY